MKVVEFTIYEVSRYNFKKYNSLKGASSMEEHLLYKLEVGGSIPSCPDIHMEWRRSIFGDESLLTITNELMVTFFDPHQNMKW